MDLKEVFTLTYSGILFLRTLSIAG